MTFIDVEAAIQELDAYLFSNVPLTPQEEAHCQVLLALVEKAERIYRLPVTLEPLETLKILMFNRELQQADLIPLLGTHVAEILNGKRDLSPEHIEKLSAFFNVSKEVFFPHKISES